MKAWIEDWLSERQRDEIGFFKKRRLLWEAEGREDVYAVIREIKDTYDLTLRLAEDKPQQFLDRWRASAGLLEDWEEVEDGKFRVKQVGSRSDFSLAVCNCVGSYEFGEYAMGGEKWLGGPVELFKLIDGRGSHFKKNQKVKTAEVKQTAEALIERDGWGAFPVQRSNTKYCPQSLAEAVARRLEKKFGLNSLSADTVRRHLKQTDFRIPRAARLKRRR